MPHDVNWQLLLQERAAEKYLAHFSMCFKFLQDFGPSNPNYLDFSLVLLSILSPWQAGWVDTNYFIIVGLMTDSLNRVVCSYCWNSEVFIGVSTPSK